MHAYSRDMKEAPVEAPEDHARQELHGGERHEMDGRVFQEMESPAAKERRSMEENGGVLYELPGESPMRHDVT